MASATTRTPPTSTTQRKAHRQHARANPALIGSAKDAGNAPKTDELSTAELAADLAALMNAGLIAPVEQHGAVRYAVINPDGPVA